MDSHIRMKPWSRLLKGKAIEVAETPELYLKLTSRCMEQVNRLCLAHGSPLPKFNLEQCKYLAIKLQLAIQSANSITEDINKEFLSLAHPKEMEQFLEIFKLLYAMGEEVEGLIQSCCNKIWIQSAMMLNDTLEHVASIGLNLEFCSHIFLARQSQRRMTNFDATRIRKVEVQIVKEKVDLDEAKIIIDLRNVIQSNASSSVDWQLATFLLGRLGMTTLPPNINSPRSQNRVFPLMITNLKQMPYCLGSGTFAIVHKATWFGVEVAKKTFYAPASADFLREVSILDGLSHPNIVSLLWSTIDGKRCHLVMELMDGDLFSLMHQRMEENGNQGCPFNIQEALDLILQIGEGMLYLHEKRIVHRDLKSRNILTRGGKVVEGNVKYLQVKVADFGLSKTKERSATYSDMSLNVGTTRWMAPEVMRVGNVRSDDVDEEREVALNYPFKIDIYSFAMICYEILTGEVPFSSLSHGEVKKAVLSGERPPLPRVCPNRLRTLIESCWSADASARPSFDNICEELRDLKYANLWRCWKARTSQCPLEDIVTISELVAKLSSPTVNVQQSAANDIHLWARKSLDHRIYIIEQSEALPLLVLLYYSEYLTVSEKHSFTALQALLDDDLDRDRDTFFRIDTLNELSLRRNTICTPGNSIYEETYLGSAIGPIIEVLKSGRMKARENAALALMKLSSNLGVDVGEKIKKSEAVPALVTLLEGGSAEGKEYAAIVLCKICHSFLELPSAVQTMIAPPLLNLIAQDSNGTMLDDAFRILVTLTKVREGLIAIAAAEPTPILVKIIASKSCRNKDSAILILRELCLHDPRFMKEAKEAKVVESLNKHPPSSKQPARALLQVLQKQKEKREGGLQWWRRRPQTN